MTDHAYTVTHLGKRYEGNPLPVVKDITTIYPAGVITFGVEGRALYHSGDDVAWAGGSALHVFDTQSGDEYLRFDAFPGYEHYHYLHPNKANDVIGFDTASNGDFISWIIDRVSHRLPELLAPTAGAKLADHLDKALVIDALQLLEKELREKSVYVSARHLDAVS